MSLVKSEVITDRSITHAVRKKVCVLWRDYFSNCVNHRLPSKSKHAPGFREPFINASVAAITGSASSIKSFVFIYMQIPLYMLILSCTQLLHQFIVTRYMISSNISQGR